MGCEGAGAWSQTVLRATAVRADNINRARRKFILTFLTAKVGEMDLQVYNQPGYP
jgi:hypothetical protein